MKYLVLEYEVVVDPFFNKVAPPGEESMTVDVGDIRGAVEYDVGRTFGYGIEAVYRGGKEAV